MVRRWPDGLPGTSFPGFDLTPLDQSRRSDMEIGSRVRRITFARLDRTRQSYRMTDSQFAAFRDWHEDGVVSVAGDSDSLSAWGLTRASLNVGAALSPDGIAADRLLETTDTGAHYASISLPGAAYDGVDLIAMASLRAAGRSKARISIFDRAGVAKYADIDLTTGTVSGSSGLISSSIKARGDYWRVWLRANSGVGVAIPSMRLQCLDATGAQSYAGTATLGLDICEIQARPAGDYELFIPCDALGKARGAAGGSAWFNVAVAFGGGLTVAEAQFTKMYSAAAGRGLNWTVSVEMMVRNA